MARSPYRSNRGNTQLPEKVRRVVEALPINQVGVFLLKNSQGKILRIGHSKDLRHRIADYFRAGAIGWPGKVETVEVIPTKSENTAQALAQELIGEHQPPYNEYNTESLPESAETRRSQILRAAAALFAQNGYQHTTVKEIAARAGISPGAIYLYFDGKRDLLLAIADHVIGQAWGQTQAAMANLDPEAYIDAILQDMLHFTRQNRPFLQAIIAEIWTDKELQEQFFKRVVIPLFENAGQYLELQIKEGTARPCQVEVVIPTIAGSLIILSLLRTLAAGGGTGADDDFLAEFSDEDLVEELKQLYFYGLRLERDETAEEA